jgi:hypothetical protein
MTRYGDIARAINGLRSPQGSIELHAALYFPCAMALRLMPCSPRRRIRLVTVVSGLIARLCPVGPACLRGLGASNGRQDHTVLPYANSAVRPARCCSLTKSRPVNNLRADALASTASRPAFVTTRDPPLLSERDSTEIDIDPDGRKAKCFCVRGLDDPNHIETPDQIAVCARRFFGGSSAAAMPRQAHSPDGQINDATCGLAI